MNLRVTAFLAIIALVLGLAVTGAYVLLGRGGARFADCPGMQVAGGSSLIGGRFSLIRQDGVRVTDDQVIDGLTLVYFGYTYCPDVCPLDLVRNADAVDLLEERGIMVTPVFITVDPVRDTPQVMADYVGYMHPRMIGLTGSEDEIEAVKTAYRVYGARASGGADDQSYLVAHTTNTYLVAPEIGTLTAFGRDTPADDLAEAVACYARKL